MACACVCWTYTSADLKKERESFCDAQRVTAILRSRRRQPPHLPCSQYCPDPSLAIADDCGVRCRPAPACASCVSPWPPSWPSWLAPCARLGTTGRSSSAWARDGWRGIVSEIGQPTESERGVWFSQPIDDSIMILSCTEPASLAPPPHFLSCVGERTGETNSFSGFDSDPKTRERF